MRKNFYHLFFCFAFCLLLLKASFGCATITVPSLTKFDSSEYIFIGEVIGIDNPIESEKFHGKAWSLKVKIKESLNLPKMTNNYFVVTPFELESDCEDKGWSKEKLLNYYPINSEIRVVAKEAKYGERKTLEGNIRLEVLPNNLGSIARNYSNSSNSITSVNSIYDYKSYVVESPCGISEDEMPDYISNRLLPNFEFRKDLLRLQNAISENEKVKILSKLVYFPSSSDKYFDLTKMFLKSNKIIKNLNHKRKQWSKDFVSKLILSC